MSRVDVSEVTESAAGLVADCAFADAADMTVPAAIETVAFGEVISVDFAVVSKDLGSLPLSPWLTDPVYTAMVLELKSSSLVDAAGFMFFCTVLIMQHFDLQLDKYASLISWI